ncbi:hypothetical protein ACFY00_05325 [Kitasatospora sp. NPDC001540]|uniref:hypothetical protein n=1 Tax=Kitasatospora sp. NPDC001540 TaxID=3364014 RepID=UPI0036A1DB51
MFVLVDPVFSGAGLARAFKEQGTDCLVLYSSQAARTGRGEGAAAWAVVTEPEEVGAALGSWTDWPVLARPATGTGAGRLCRTPAQVREAVTALRTGPTGAQRPVLLHGRPDGSTYEVLTVSSAGRHLVVEVYRLYESEDGAVLTHRDSVAPAPRGRGAGRSCRG